MANDKPECYLPWADYILRQQRFIYRRDDRMHLLYRFGCGLFPEHPGGGRRQSSDVSDTSWDSANDGADGFANANAVGMIIAGAAGR
jgi:hypothetical protein